MAISEAGTAPLIASTGTRKSLSLGTMSETKARAGMPLKLYFHPLSSFCWKALIALYENGTAFEPRIVDLMDPADNAAFKQVWPIGKFPVLRDDAKNRTIPESSIISRRRTTCA